MPCGKEKSVSEAETEDATARDRSGALVLESGRQDIVDGIPQVPFLQNVRDPDLVGAEVGSRVEPARGRHHHRRSALLEVGQHPARKVVAVVDRQTGDEVEGAFRLREEDARQFPQALVKNVPASLILGNDSGDVFRAEVEGADGDELREARGRKPCAIRSAARWTSALRVTRQPSRMPQALYRFERLSTTTTKSRTRGARARSRSGFRHTRTRDRPRR